MSEHRDFTFINVTVYIRTFAHRQQEHFCDPLIGKEELFKATGKPRMKQLRKIFTSTMCSVWEARNYSPYFWIENANKSSRIKIMTQINRCFNFRVNMSSLTMLSS